MKTSVLVGTQRLIGAMVVAVFFLFVSGCASTQGQVDAATVMSAQEVDAEMVKWYRKAAERGVASAQFLLGMSYADGKGVAEDDAEAARWYRKAAEKGLAEAQFNLGTVYANGEGIAEDDARAVKWYRKAAEQGDARAQHNLALMYDFGEGIAEDDAEAVKWYRKAADHGDGIWRSPHGRGIAADAYQNEVLEADARVDAWRRATFEVLKRHVDPASNGGLTEDRPFDYLLPVLSSHDRRATLRSLWSPLFPEAHWQGVRSHPIGGTQIYLDVSGSMAAEMPLIVKLLSRLSRYIERPFWAFSNLVARAEIRNGRLVAETTGGTSMACVLEHVARTRPPAAVIVTDGYIEQLPRDLVQSTSATRLHAIVTRDGSGNRLQQAHIPFTQLGRLPQ